MTIEQNSVHANALEIVTFLVRRGYTVDYDRHANLIDIAPTPPPELAVRLEANEQILIAMLRLLDGRPATAHAFVAHYWSKREEVRERGVCLACGIPWAFHGEPAIEHWKIVEDVNRVRTLGAVPLPIDCECGVTA